MVDDDAVFREELAELLRDERHEVTACPSVPKALEELAHGEFDAILSDLKMPRQGGLDLLREVRARYPSTPLVIVTGFATVETAVAAMKSGAAEYIQKPFKIDQVRDVLQHLEISEALRHSAHGDELRAVLAHTPAARSRSSRWRMRLSVKRASGIVR